MPGQRNKVGRGSRSRALIGRKMKRHLVIQEDPIGPLQLFHNVLKSATLPDGWYFRCTDKDEIQCFYVTRQSIDAAPMVMSRILIINKNLSWVVYINNHLISPSNEVLRTFPSTLNTEVLLNLVNTLHTSNVCSGNHDDSFISLGRQKKGTFLSVSGQVVAVLHELFCFMVNGESKSATIRHVNCDILLAEEKITCPSCTGYRNTLRALVSKSIKPPISPRLSSHANLRFLRTPQRQAHLAILQKAIRNKNRQLKRLRVRLNMLLENKASICVDKELSSDIERVIENHRVMEKDEFKQIFWEQQVAASKVKKNGVRWHPLFIRWCLNIMLTSSKTYEIIRESGFISLPSKRTLQDYTHWIKLQPGFNVDVFEYLRKEMNVDGRSDWEKYVVLAFDEMKIREDLVFEKSTGEVIGFVDYGEGSLDQKFVALREQCMKQNGFDHSKVATHMLTLMVRGIFFKCDFPLAHFSTQGVPSESLIYIVWRAIRMLALIGLQVISVVADGASNNRRFFWMHKISKFQCSGITYKAPNITNPGSFVYFIADPPHLIKTVRNAWYNSQANGSRNLVNKGKEIKWAHLVELAEKSSSDSGLYIGKKLTREHLKLTSYSRMNVRLAVQVLSTSVANGFKSLRKLEVITQDTEATEEFCRIFDKFFDLFNTRSVTECIRTRKPDVMPYYKASDPRLTWLKETFLQYLSEWEDSVYENDAIPKPIKKCCMLPHQTLEGLKICVYSLTEMMQELLFNKNAKFVLSDRFSQDTLEIFFGQQRSRGHCNDNPSVLQFLQNAQALTVQKSLALGGSSNISSKKREDPLELSSICSPLPKRRCLRNS